MIYELSELTMTESDVEESLGFLTFKNVISYPIHKARKNFADGNLYASYWIIGPEGFLINIKFKDGKWIVISKESEVQKLIQAIQEALIE